MGLFELKILNTNDFMGTMDFVSIIIQAIQQQETFCRKLEEAKQTEL